MPAFLLASFSRAFCLVGAAGFGRPGDRTPNLRITRMQATGDQAGIAGHGDHARVCAVYGGHCGQSFGDSPGDRSSTVAGRVGAHGPPVLPRSMCSIEAVRPHRTNALHQPCPRPRAEHLPRRTNPTDAPDSHFAPSSPNVSAASTSHNRADPDGLQPLTGLGHPHQHRPTPVQIDPRDLTSCVPFAHRGLPCR